MKEGPAKDDGLSRRDFLRVMGGAAATAAVLGAGGAEAQEEKKGSESPGPNAEKQPELPANLKIVKEFADGFLEMFSTFDKDLTVDKLPSQVGGAINWYFKAFAVAQDVDPKTRLLLLDVLVPRQVVIVG